MRHLFGLTHLCGIRPWEIGLLAPAEFLGLCEQLEDIHQQQKKQQKKANGGG